MPHGWLTLLLVGASVKRQDGAGAPRVVDSAAGGRLGIQAHRAWEVPVPHGWLTLLLVGASVKHQVRAGAPRVADTAAGGRLGEATTRSRCPTGG